MVNKKKSKKNQNKSTVRNVNNETIAALKRLSVALKELDNRGASSTTSTNAGVALSHYSILPEEVTQSYKMLQDGASAIQTISTKYTLMAKISLEDGSTFASELRQGCELISTATFLVHQPISGCGRSTRTYLKSKSLAIVNSVTSLIEAFVSGEALNGNVGAQLTGAVWQACEAAESLPKGNRACMRRDLFSWVRECNDTMEEFQVLVDLGPADGDNDDDDVNGGGQEDEDARWDDFCNNPGTGEQYTDKEMPIVEASLALIKCSRGILNLSLKACDCASDEVEKNGDNQDTDRKMQNMRWISNIHQISRKVGEGATDLGCIMYPPLNLSLRTQDGTNDTKWQHTDIGSQILEQSNNLLSAAHLIDNPILSEGQQQIKMSVEIEEMCSKLLSAIERRTNEAKEAIDDVLL